MPSWLLVLSEDSTNCFVINTKLENAIAIHPSGFWRTIQFYWLFLGHIFGISLLLVFQYKLKHKDTSCDHTFEWVGLNLVGFTFFTGMDLPGFILATRELQLRTWKVRIEGEIYDSCVLHLIENLHYKFLHNTEKLFYYNICLAVGRV